MADFDPTDKYSWYFGPLSREEANEKLVDVRTNGVFLIRESQSIKGDYVLVVREDSKISHYIINKVQVGGSELFRIGDQQFPDIPALLNFYKTHYLDTTALTFPATRDKVYCRYDFPGKDAEDLPFKRGDILEVISKDEEKWWCARDKNGRVGQIPVPYVTAYKPDPKPVGVITPSEDPVSPPAPTGFQLPKKLPARAIVIHSRIPSIYDKEQLRLNEGDVLTVLEINPNGQWRGQIGERVGIFPFTHVKFMDENS
ncbi:adapter molecule Crk-like isoform X2 [Dreissena polymorpha]|uniref:Adapter molecule Crk n=1 Tax=Dreissena polymorpha TaxID=45954 RepID=A0A9D4MV96_DREPO|nr:adapter molecule Crk-like isoform X2 [Dreissena polymorpha]KAH3884527.1 hypothetical protein DPMN_008509 [Dreissena polymorpha]